jgi:hypothetical protein
LRVKVTKRVHVLDAKILVAKEYSEYTIFDIAAAGA